MSFAGKVIAGMAILLAGTTGLLFLWPGGSEAEVCETVREMIREAQAGETDLVVRRIDPGYQHEGMTCQEITSLVRHYLNEPRTRSFQWSGLEAEAAGSTARAWFTVRFEEEALGARFPVIYEIVLHLRKSGDSWRVTAADADRR